MLICFVHVLLFAGSGKLENQKTVLTNIGPNRIERGSSLAVHDPTPQVPNRDVIVWVTPQRVTPASFYFIGS